MTRLVLLLAISAAGLYLHVDKRQSPPQLSSEIDPARYTSLETIQRTFTNRQSNLPIVQTGGVIAVLKKDRAGIEHQRFIIELAPHQKLLIAHNTDLAPEIENLKVNDSVSFSGEYEWNDKGGVVNWTHHDPNGRHPGGWLRHNGRLYQYPPLFSLP